MAVTHRQKVRIFNESLPFKLNHSLPVHKQTQFTMAMRFRIIKTSIAFVGFWFFLLSWAVGQFNYLRPHKTVFTSFFCFFIIHLISTYKLLEIPEKDSEFEPRNHFNCSFSNSYKLYNTRQLSDLWANSNYNVDKCNIRTNGRTIE